MKQITFLVVLVALFTASCSNKNGMFTKRKYTKGHYIAHVGKVQKPQAHEAKATDRALPVQVKSEYVKPTISAANANNTAFAAASNVKSQTTHAVKPVQVSTQQHEQTVTKTNLTQKVANHRAINKISHAKKEKASDDNLIIWVILSLFPILCLIAVYMHDGKAVTTNFWIDLVLHITFWGCCLFALLVVLDIIDLS